MLKPRGITFVNSFILNWPGSLQKVCCCYLPQQSNLLKILGRHVFLFTREISGRKLLRVNLVVIKGNFLFETKVILHFYKIIVENYLIDAEVLKLTNCKNIFLILSFIYLFFYHFIAFLCVVMPQLPFILLIVLTRFLRCRFYPCSI